MIKSESMRILLVYLTHAMFVAVIKLMYYYFRLVSSVEQFL